MSEAKSFNFVEFQKETRAKRVGREPEFPDMRKDHRKRPELRPQSKFTSSKPVKKTEFSMNKTDFPELPTGKLEFKNPVSRSTIFNKPKLEYKPKEVEVDQDEIDAKLDEKYKLLTDKRIANMALLELHNLAATSSSIYNEWVDKIAMEENLPKLSPRSMEKYIKECYTFDGDFAPPDSYDPIDDFCEDELQYEETESHDLQCGDEFYEDHYSDDL